MSTYNNAARYLTREVAQTLLVSGLTHEQIAHDYGVTLAYVAKVLLPPTDADKPKEPQAQQARKKQRTGRPYHKSDVSHVCANGHPRANNAMWVNVNGIQRLRCRTCLDQRTFKQ